MTKKNALTVALTALTAMNSDESNEAIGVLTKMIEGLNARPRTDEQKAKQNEKRKAATANARAEMVAKVIPILREELTHTLQGVTAKELFDLAKHNLPEDFTAPKVQNILLREMKPELTITETKGKANTYILTANIQ